MAKYNHYTVDADFLKVKARHDDLRAKLAVIKDRVKDFDLKEQKRRSEARKPQKDSTNHRRPPREAPPPFQENNRATDLTVM